MRKLILLLGIVAQVGVLAYMVYGRESIVQSGQRIEITTAPIDPRDPFRGDFVRLAYPMNSLSFNVSTVTGESRQFPRDAVFYTSLKPEPGGTYAAYQFGDEKPSEGVFIKGHLQRKIHWTPAYKGYADLRYGLEQMFVEQGSGIAIEERQGVRGGLQVPMHVEVALGDNGTGIITGFRWNAVGAQLEIGAMELPRETDAEASNEPSELEPALWLTLQNVSAEPVQMSLAGELCHLSLQLAFAGSEDIEPAFEGCNADSAEGNVTLQPQQEHKLAIDLADPRWHVRRVSDGEVNDLRLIDPRQRFRIEYSYSSEADKAGGQNLWQGIVRTNAFTGLGRID